MSPGSSHATPFRSIRRATFAQLLIAIVSRQEANIGKLARGGNARNWKSIYRLFRSSNFVKVTNQFRGAKLWQRLSSAAVLSGCGSGKRASLPRVEGSVSANIFRAMAKEEQIVTEGTVTEVLPGTMVRVDLAG